MILFDNYWNASLNEMLKQYQQQKGVQITWEMPPLSGFYQRQMSLSLAKEKKPDIIAGNDTILSQYAGSGLIEPLDDYLKEANLAGADYNWTEFPEQTRKAASWSKDSSSPAKVYGLPFELATWAYFYRSDLIEKPPETFTDYIEIAKQFTKSINPKSPTEYGAAIQGKQLPPQYKEWYAWLWAYGGEIFDDKLQPVINSSAAVKSLEDDYGLLLNLKATPPDTASYDNAAATAAFQNGLFPQMILWTNQYPIYVDAEKSPKIAGKVKYAMVPGMPGPDGKVKRFPYAQQWMLGLNPNGEHKEEAFKVIAWLTSPKGQLAWAKAGYAGVVRPSVLKDPEMQKKNPDFVVRLEATAIGRYGPTFVPEYAQIADSELLPALSQVLAGTKSAKSALDQVNEKATTIMKSAGHIK
ncbi:MAG: extracellular solute-binding protein [Dehalococcoidales bacterium]|nr:extracellular solute-binding protein [Dehalococcoidales bacterium]